ncbi:EAL domain-containing protein [Methylibium petroleiphilum]|uniref:Diguanylate cyclase/phosphodiesterase with PAS/PAC sensor(S) n=1 Tax=Methylibium petroleiphilum (strain ATCC BAA-1232 / LMG 22953 / PM1) TaxID=420662 RepID=A2SIS6_METPP|nr:EAL domain-containing protein [Methylibium petroleiphilum]ABM95465.1 diguanylate cyclase/phosphodiesterase with PAS/PAC sensor(s) [Methylibium petroleiphilum PM1]
MTTPPPVWEPLIGSLLEAVCLVEPLTLHVVAANEAAAALFGQPVSALVGRPVIELSATPEDECFWEDMAAGVGTAEGPQIHSDSFVRHADGRMIPVERRVNRIWMRPGQAIFVLGLRDQSAQRQAEDELEKLVAELRATLESTAEGILVTDLHGAIRGCNQLFAQLWDMPVELLTQRDDSQILEWMRGHVVDEQRFVERMGELDRDPLLRASDVLRLRSGRVLERVVLPQYGRGQPIGRVCSFRDITEQLASAARLQLAAQVFESSLDAIFVTDGEHRIAAVNASCERITGLGREQLVGLRTEALLHPPGADDADTAWFELVREQLAHRGVWEGELWHRRADGSTLPGQVSLVRLAAEGTDPGETGVRHVGFFKDLTETVAAQKRIEELAFTDALTGLPNRVMLAERLDFALAMSHRHQTPFALLFLDLDRFKQINDSLGHVFGDRVLVEVAERLKTCLRQIDTVARLGGDEFVMLLNQTDARGAEAIARRVLEVLGQPFTLEGMSFSVTASIGIAMYPNDGESMDDLIKNADAAMYRVKERGRAGFRFYQPQMNVDLLARMKLDHSMRLALERGDFRLHYQPQIDIASNAVVGAEALLRWRDPGLGDVSPGEFIPVAEESGFIVALGEWVLREAVRQAALWRAQGRSMVVSVNVSALQFQQADFVDRVATALAEAKLPATWLELELTESILIRDADEALQRLRALDRLGVQLAIDDFGTGYSSLGYLKRFPIRKLKIDRSFIKGLPGDESDAGIAQAVIQVARALRLRVIAEGVETMAQRDFLQRAGCDEIQGFLFAPALPVAEFEARTATMLDLPSGAKARALA